MGQRSSHLFQQLRHLWREPSLVMVLKLLVVAVGGGIVGTLLGGVIGLAFHLVFFEHAAVEPAAASPLLHELHLAYWLVL